MYIQLQEKKRKKLFKIAYYTLLQFSILSLGIFVGCWVTVNGSLQSLELKDPQIVAIRDTGISFTILFAISFILTIVSYLFYNSNGSLVNISKKNPNLSVNANDLPKKVDNSLTINNKKDDMKPLSASERKEIKEVNEILKELEFKTHKKEDIKEPSIKRIVSPSNEVKQLSSSSLKPVQQVSSSSKMLSNSTAAKNQLISTPVSRTVVPVSKNVVAPTLNKPISTTLNNSNAQVSRLTTSVNPNAKTVIRPVSVNTIAPKKVVPAGSRPVAGQTIVRTATASQKSTAPKTVVYSTYRTVNPTNRKVAPIPNKSIYKVQKN